MTTSLESPATRRVGGWLIGLPAAAALLVIVLAIGDSNRANSVVPIATAPTAISTERLSHTEDSDDVADGVTIEVSMNDMLDLAQSALTATVANLDDYTTRMVKQEQDRNGVLQPASESFMKVRTRHQGGRLGSPLGVYMRFDAPEEVKGREVIWVENRNDGKLLVREAGMVGAMATIPLPPNGFLAMRGQRYPITEIGLTRLLEKLIERGARDRDNPDVHVFKTEGHPFDGRALTLLQIQRHKPSGEEGDFSSAELILDRAQNLVVSFRSFGWPAAQSTDSDPPQPPLIESYEYHDLKLNVGLTDHDFDPANPEYTFAE